MKADALIAARMGSSRFAGKSLADLAGMPMLERMLQRIKVSKNIDRVVLATTTEPTDNPLAAWCKASGVGCYRGSTDDVLGRLSSAADAFGMNIVAEMLGDNPLVHSDLIDAAIERYEEGDCDYVATVTNEYPIADKALRRFPIGIRVQVLSAATLRKCAELAREQRHREHATSFIGEHPEIFRTAYVEAAGSFAALNRPDLTLAVNYRANLDLIRGIFAACYARNPNFGVGDAIAAIDADPALRRLMGNDVEQ